MQIYLEGTAFILENKGAEIADLLTSINSTQRNKEKLIKDHITEKVGDSYSSLKRYLTSKRDRDCVTDLLTKISSVKAVTNLAKVQDKRYAARSRALVFSNLIKFEDMKREIDRDQFHELPKEQRRQKINSLLEKKKVESLKHIYKGRGRKFKIKDFPNLAGILEFAFGVAG